MARDSSVGIATRYELDGPGIESRWGRNFPHPSRPALGPIHPPTQRLPGLSPGNKATSAWRWPPQSGIEVKERVEIPLLPLWAFMACYRANVACNNNNNNKKKNTEANGGVVGWGTALQAGRSWVRFQMVSLEFFVDVILPAALWPWGRFSL